MAGACHVLPMQEFSLLNQAFSQLVLQIPILIAGVIGLILLGRNQALIGAAALPAFIGILVLIGLGVVGPFYQAWITKIIVEKGASGSSSLFLLSTIVVNTLWAVGLLLLISSIFVGRRDKTASPSEVER